jgi:hypothetical protein
MKNGADHEPLPKIGMEKTKVHGCLCLGDKSYSRGSLLGIGETCPKGGSAKEILFIDAPAVWMGDDDIRGIEVIPPNRVSSYHPFFEELSGMLEEVGHEIAVYLTERDARWKF